MHLFWHADQSGNLVAAVLLNHIDTGMGVAASPDKDQFWFAHGAIGTRPELLGILIKRRSSDSATGKGAIGALLYIDRRFISAQTGRVIRPASLVAVSTASRWSASDSS